MPKKAQRRRKGTPARRGNRLIAYIRVSDITGREDTLISPDVQLREIRALAAREGLVIVDTVEDIDKSGTSFEGRKIAACIDRVEAGEADGVAVWKISRWGRNLVDSLLNIKELENAGGYVVSASESLDSIDTPAGGLSLVLLLAIAEMFSKEVGATWSSIHRYRLSNGKTIHGTARLGYVRDKETDSYSPDPVTSAWVRSAFERYVAGESIRSIVARMSAGGITSTRGNPLSSNSLRTSMDSGFAAGLLVTRDDEGATTFIPGDHPALITEEVWRLYRRRRDSAAPARTKSAPYRVAGLLVCGGCGAGMSVSWNSKTKERTLRCNRKNQQGNPCPAPATVYQHRADAAVRQWLLEHAEGDTALQTQIQRQQHVDRAIVDVARIDRDIAKQTRRLSILADKIIDGEISKDTGQMKDAEIRENIRRLQRSRTDAEVSVEVHSMPALDVFGACLMGWDLLDPAIVNEALRKVVGSVTVHRGLSRRAGSVLKIRGAWEPDLRVVPRAG